MSVLESLGETSSSEDGTSNAMDDSDDLFEAEVSIGTVKSELKDKDDTDNNGNRLEPSNNQSSASSTSKASDRSGEENEIKADNAESDSPQKD